MIQYIKKRKIRFIFLLVFILLFVIATYFRIKYSKYYALPEANESYAKLVAKKGHGIGVYVINLDRAQKRMQNLKVHLKELKMPYQRISGVDGNKMTDDEIQKVFDIDSFRRISIETPTKGVVGCYMSHMKVLKTFLESDFEYAVVLEDDIAFNGNELRAAIEDVANYRELWDVVQFGRSNSYGKFDLFAKVKIKHMEKTGLNLFSYYLPLVNMYCFIINRKAANILLSRAFPMKNSAEFYLLDLSKNFSVLTTERIAIQVNNIDASQSDIASSTKIDKKDSKKNRTDDAKLLLSSKIDVLFYYIETTVTYIFYRIKNIIRLLFFI